MPLRFFRNSLPTASPSSEKMRQNIQNKSFFKQKQTNKKRAVIITSVFLLLNTIQKEITDCAHTRAAWCTGGRAHVVVGRTTFKRTPKTTNLNCWGARQHHWFSMVKELKQQKDLVLSWRHLSTTDVSIAFTGQQTAFGSKLEWPEHTTVSLFRGRTFHPTLQHFSFCKCTNPDNSSFLFQQVHFIWVAKFTCCHAYTFFYERELAFLVALPAFASNASPEPGQLELLPLKNGHILSVSGSWEWCPSPRADKVTQWEVSRSSLVGAKGQTQNSEQWPQI